MLTIRRFVERLCILRVVVMEISQCFFYEFSYDMHNVRQTITVGVLVLMCIPPLMTMQVRSIPVYTQLVFGHSSNYVYS